MMLDRRYGSAKSGTSDTVRRQLSHKLAPHADHAVEADAFQRAAIEAVSCQWTLSLALRALAWPTTFGIGKFCVGCATLK